ncbi:MAG: hypothetical protein QM539_09150 [Alphaproteobacteria bacterium]|nr:hypothetical protein [Alphaproteobacteria bacterium]
MAVARKWRGVGLGGGGVGVWGLAPKVLKKSNYAQKILSIPINVSGIMQEGSKDCPKGPHPLFTF